MKKIIALLLALILTLGMCGTISASTGSRTVYFVNTELWSQVAAFCFNEQEERNEAYPGELMTPVEGDIYSYEVDNRFDWIIFVNATTENWEASGDLLIPTDGRNMYNFRTKEWTVSPYGGSTDDTDDPDDPNDPDPNDPVTPPADEEAAPSVQTKSVTGTCAEGEGTAVVSVELNWGGMHFIYAQSETVWDAEKHEYVPALNESGQPVQDGGWKVAEDSANFITLTNHSNVQVSAELSFDAEVNAEVTGAFFSDEAMETETTTINLASAVDTDPSNAPAQTVYFNITDGEIEEEMENIGTITVTIKAKTDYVTAQTDWDPDDPYALCVGLPSGWEIPGLGFYYDTDLNCTITLTGATVKDGTKYEWKHSEYDTTLTVEKSGENTLSVKTATSKEAFDNMPDPTTWECTIQIAPEDLIADDGYTIPAEGITIPFPILYST